MRVPMGYAYLFLILVASVWFHVEQIMLGFDKKEESPHSVLESQAKRRVAHVVPEFS